jgi:hypothetical protein
MQVPRFEASKRTTSARMSSRQLERSVAFWRTDDKLPSIGRTVGTATRSWLARTREASRFRGKSVEDAVSDRSDLITRTGLFEMQPSCAVDIRTP